MPLLFFERLVFLFLPPRPRTRSRRLRPLPSDGLSRQFRNDPRRPRRFLLVSTRCRLPKNHSTVDQCTPGYFHLSFIACERFEPGHRVHRLRATRPLINYP